ncbi:MAG: PQQ-dependent sugar dehydrogenase [Pseudomonadota bacterium]
MRSLLVLLALLPWLSSAGAIDLRATEIASLPTVTDIRNAGDGSNRIFMTQISGAVRIIENGQLLEEPFIDIRSDIRIGAEEGLLSIAFSPDYDVDGEFYLFYSDTFGRSVVARYRVSENPNVADAASGQVILAVNQPLPNHNGGRVVFGPDWMLYVALGDGGGAGDPEENGQDGRTRLGTILRLDVIGQNNFAIPADNPYVNDPDVRDDAWAIGLRNPWRMSFDRDTGALYIADVGQNEFEEINFEPPGFAGGANYGWNLYEGDTCFSNCTGSEDVVFPVLVYDHSSGRCSITGGEVYRGPDYPALQGTYLYGDFCSGEVFGLTRQPDGSWQNELLLSLGFSVFTFGEDERGNVYVAGGGRVLLLSDGEPAGTPGVPIDGSFSGTYVVEGLNDQGFFVTIDERPDGSRFAFIAWFTFEAGAPLWLVGVGEIAADADSVEMTMDKVEGLNFLDFSTTTGQRETFGTMRFVARDCDLLETTYDFGDRGTGTLDLARLTGIEGRDCRAAR